MNAEKKQGNIIAIIMMIFLFGMISFVTNLAAPMGVVLKTQFGVSNAAGMLGNMANFIAYLFMGIPAGKMLSRLGYKKTALIAVAVGLVGLFVQYMSGYAANFTVYLLGAFICGFSVCMLNTVVNPMLNTLGGGGKRGNMLLQIGGSFNSLLGAIVPMVIGLLVANIAKANITDVFPLMYIAMGIFALIFILLLIVPIPEPHISKEKKSAVKDKYSPWSFRHFVLGAVAIFIYVGVEVGIPGTANLYMTAYTMEQAAETQKEYAIQQEDPAYLAALIAEDNANDGVKDYVNRVISESNNKMATNIIEGKTSAGLNIPTGVAGTLVTIYWLLMLVGRLTGGAIGSKVSSKQMLIVAASVAAIFILCAIFVPASIGVNIAGLIGHSTQLIVPLSIIFMLLCGLCTSVMWGGIFNLAVEGLGKYTPQASGIFMMMVVGGGILPFIQSWVADMSSYVVSYWVPAIGLAYLLFYALIGSKNVNKNIPVE